MNYQPNELRASKPAIQEIYSPHFGSIVYLGANITPKYTIKGRIRALAALLRLLVFIMTPFIQQIDPKIEHAARMCGAGTMTVLARILSPLLLLPGMLAAGILVLARTFGMFELTFLTSGPRSQTLIVALFSAVDSAGILATQSVDAMAVIYTGSMAVIFLIALRFVNPTQLVARSSD